MSSAIEGGPSSSEETKPISAAASASDEPNTPPPAVAKSLQENRDTSSRAEGGDTSNTESIADAQIESDTLKAEDGPDVSLAAAAAEERATLDDIEMKGEHLDTISDSDKAKEPVDGSVSAQAVNEVMPAPAVESSVETGPFDTIRTSTEEADAAHAPVPISDQSTSEKIEQEVTAAQSLNRNVDDKPPAEPKATALSEPGIDITPAARASFAEGGSTGARLAVEDTQSQDVQMGSLPSVGASIDPDGTLAESSGVAAKRTLATRHSAETQQRARQDESVRLQRENEDMRLQWLSLPANDHITYYSDTEDDASSDPGDVMTRGPAGTYGGMPHLNGVGSRYSNNRKRNRQAFDDEKESSDSDDEKMDQEGAFEDHRYRTGNRGNKLLKSSRWIRRGKLGIWTEAKTEKDFHDRFMTRVKAIQRAGVESLLHNAPGPKMIKEDGSLSKDLLEGSDRLLLRDVNKPIVIKENLHSTSLAPALLRPILSARALLESHTLRHTFRNPHIGALSKTALDLRESESQLAKALGRCFAAMERTSAYVQEPETGRVRVNGSQSTDGENDVHIIGAENTAGTADEVNPALYRLEDLFITKKGLPIPVSAGSDNDSQATACGDPQAVLSTTDQRNVVRAALECLTDLAADSLEYVERLEEVRGRLESVKRQRTQVWEALRLWAVKREFGEEEEEEDVVDEANGIDPVSNRPLTKPGTAPASVATANRRRR